MSNLTAEEREWLGIAPGALAELLAESVSSESAAAQGAGASLSLAVIAAQLLLSDPPPPRVELQGLRENVGRFALYDVGWRRKAVVARGGVALVHRGSWAPVEPREGGGEDEIVVVEEPALVELVGESGRGVLRMRDGVASLYVIRDAAESARIDALVASAIRPAEVPVPDIAAFVSGVAAPPWLLKTADERRASQWSLWRVAAAGLVGRLWSPPRGSLYDPSAAIIDGADGGPTARAIAWFASLDGAAREHALAGAHLEVERLIDALPDLECAIAEDPATARDQICQWLHARDDLECVAFLVEPSDSPNPLRRQLEALDQQASSFHAMYLDIAPFDDDRLVAVATLDPDAWWGRLARL